MILLLTVSISSIKDHSRVQPRSTINPATPRLRYIKTRTHTACVLFGHSLSFVEHQWPLKMMEWDILLDGKTNFNLLAGYMEFHSTLWCHALPRTPSRSRSICYQIYVLQPAAREFWPLQLLKAVESPVGFSTRKNHFKNTRVSDSGRGADKRVELVRKVR